VAGGSLSVLIGMLLLRVVVDGSAVDYVQPVMQPFLVVAGLVIGGIGLWTLADGRAWGDGAGHAGLAGHAGHAGHGPERVGWWLLAPVVVLFAVAPGALDVTAVSADDTMQVRARRGEWAPLDANGVNPLTLSEFADRAFDPPDGVESIRTATVRLVGFVAKGGPADGLRIARFTIACCAADALVAKVDVLDVAAPPPVGTWVEVEGTFVPGGTVPQLRARSLAIVSEPANTYE
jgi:uncharacterized repeat protein (TIGR03943 family)